MPLLSDIARRRKIQFFLEPISEEATILEIGSGSGWVGDYLKSTGRKNYTGIDIVPPADVVGDINDWESLGMTKESFDYIIAFEVVEHVDIYPACESLLKSSGKLLVTTPVPEADWIMKCLESLGLNQKRTSPHSNLHKLQSVNGLDLTDRKVIAGLSQWGVFAKR